MLQYESRKPNQINMKQRISVRAIIQQEAKTLVLKRANGRTSILGQYELPGGKLLYGEQPEDALRRYLHDDVGIHIEHAQLFDIVTYIDHDDRDIQYAVIVYVVTIVNGKPIALSGNYSKYKWQVMSKNHQDELTDLTQLVMGIIQQEEITDESLRSGHMSDVNNSSKDTVTIFSDGGSRGNPGPSAAGYVIVDDQRNVIAEGGEYLGITNNSQAEYHGVRLGLERAIELGIKKVNFRIDSMMVVNQMKGFYKIKNRELWPIHERIRSLLEKFDVVTFHHVQREFNQLADGMVNKTLDAHELQQTDSV